MSVVIRVENLGKKYRIQHQQRERYTALRDVISNRVKSIFRNFKFPVPNFKSEEEFWALKDVSFEIKQGDVVGIVGRNGAGKSTLLKILSRITEPTEGRVSVKGRIASLLEVGTGFHPELTGRENVFLNGSILGMSKDEIRGKFDEIVAFAEIDKFLDTPVKWYSSGMYVKLAFAVAAHLETEILVTDEVLAVGDDDFQKKCLNKMENVSRMGRTVLFVSHNISSMSQLCTKGILLKNGQLQTKGGIHDVIDHYLNEGKSNETTFEGHWVERANVKQVNDRIEISVEYNASRELALPCLGFVISDYLGNPICGTNPVIDQVSPLTIPRKKGRVRAILEYPKLLNGAYKLSVWFGDGKTDYFFQKDCLIFEVVNMQAKRQLPIAVAGPVFAECEWFFDISTE